MENTRQNKMGTMPENKLLLSMAVPMMLSMMGYNVLELDKGYKAWAEYHGGDK